MAKAHDDDAVSDLLEEIHGSPEGRRERALGAALAELEGPARQAKKGLQQLQTQGQVSLDAGPEPASPAPALAAPPKAQVGPEELGPVDISEDDLEPAEPPSHDEKTKPGVDPPNLILREPIKVVSGQGRELTLRDKMGP